MTRTILARFPSYELAKRYEADLINEGKYQAKELQVRRRSGFFAVVERL